MDTDSPKKSPISSEEEECSGDEDRSEGRRRRFCLERKQSASVQYKGGSRPKRARIDTTNRPKEGYNRTSNGRQRFCDDYKQSKRLFPSTNKPQPPLPVKEPPNPVIYINPRFVKKFIEKSIKLASSSSIKTTNSSPSNQSNVDGSNLPVSSETSMIDEIDFKTSSKETLQAASTMAIIRLVTECIENDSKRDENFNKILISRLIVSLMQHGMPKQEPANDVEDNLNNQNASTNCNLGISDEDGDDVESGGRPIPVIGGSVNHHFNKNQAYYFDPSKRNQNHYQRARRMSSDRNNVRHPDIQKNKLRNIS